MKNDGKPWRVVEEKIEDDFHIFRTRKSRRINPRTGNSFEFFLIDGQDWANVIALTPDNQVVLVKQFRHGADQYTLELPGGTVEPGEDPGVAAMRELGEEAGYIASDPKHLGSFHANPAMLSIKCHIYLAHNARSEGTTALDPGEDIEVVLVPLEQVLDMIKKSEFSHGLHCAAFGLYLLNERISS